MQTSTPDYALRGATYNSLLKRTKERLLEMCTERNLIALADMVWTKRDLIQLLLAWRENNCEVPPESMPLPASSNMDLSPSSHASIFDSRPSHPPVVPLLSAPSELEAPFSAMTIAGVSTQRPGHPARQGNGRAQDSLNTPDPTPRATPPMNDSDLEAVALDLDALNMQHKRISSDRLVKQEKGESGHPLV